MSSLTSNKYFILPKSLSLLTTGDDSLDFSLLDEEALFVSAGVLLLGVPDKFILGMLKEKISL